MLAGNGIAPAVSVPFERFHDTTDPAFAAAVIKGHYERPVEVPHKELDALIKSAAKLNSKSPLDPATIDMKKSQELFEIYCAICHGNTGDGKGKLVTQGKFLGVPNYKDRQITEGSVNQVINFGLNSMGSYANQLNQTERWMVAAYVMKLKAQ